MAGYVKPENARYTGAPAREEHQQKLLESYRGGAFVVLDTNGEFVEISGTPASVTAIYGIDHYPAEPSAAATARDLVRNVEAATTNAEIRISISHSGDETLALTAANLVGKKYELRKVVVGSEEYWTVDINGTANPAVQIQKISPEFPLGEQHGTVYAKVMKTLLQYQP